MPTAQFRTVDSPVGPLTLAGQGRRLMHLRMADQTYEPSHDGWEPDETAFPDAVEQLEEYFAGTRTEFELELELVGTAFQRRVWGALLTIPYGETRSYSEVAESIAAPAAVRAVAGACARNRVSLVIPCHRVVRGTGALGGYRWGLARKERLLAREHGFAARRVESRERPVTRPSR